MESNQTESSTLFKEPVSHAEQSDAQPGALDGITIMRYAPFYRERSNGGVEQSLRCLNHGLLQRHRLTILQVHRVKDLRNHQIEVENVGKGRILWIPVAFRPTRSSFGDLPVRARFVYDQTLQWHRRNSNGGQRRPTRKALGAVLRNRFEDLRHKSVVVSNPLCELLETHGVSLLALHGLTYDADTLVASAKTSGIPFVLVSHFDNALLSQPQVRNWIPHAAAVGSVSGSRVPDYIRDRCINLSDAIDTDFFSLDASPVRDTVPAILLPALIKPGKGHLDLLQAASMIAARNLDFKIFCAGAVEDESLFQQLQDYAIASGLESRVHFLGELPQVEIRNCYAQSSIVVLPSYTEGLPRVLVEAQAMERPVVAYDSSGGIAETFVPNETGFLLKTGDVESLAGKLGFLLENASERSRMGKRGRQFVVRRFNIPAFIQRHEDLYLKILSGKIMPSPNSSPEAP